MIRLTRVSALSGSSRTSVLSLSSESKDSNSSAFVSNLERFTSLKFRLRNGLRKSDTVRLLEEGGVVASSGVLRL